MQTRSEMGKGISDRKEKYRGTKALVIKMG